MISLIMDGSHVIFGDLSHKLMTRLDVSRGAYRGACLQILFCDAVLRMIASHTRFPIIDMMDFLESR